ncbi:MAG TPA: hypothetical protein GX700_16385 [Paracoccus sp.]|nr:hypothetical protein [Paracoccus sp. (in: a-proteobacteria)]
MTTLSLDPPARQSLIRRLPLLGPIARELAEGDADYPLYLVAAALALWGCTFMIWGLPALVMPALIAAPLMLVLLVLITRG